MALSLNSEIKKTEELKEIEKTLAQKVILPQHFKYKIRKGDTLEKIARKFNVSIKDLLAINDIKNKDQLIAGKTLLIPGQPSKPIVVLKTPKISQINIVKVEALSEVGDILVPVSGLNQRLLHGNNGVDISAECGTPVYSAESGIVIESYDGWNGGYGNYILIQHKNFETLYGHLSQRYVNIGDYVEKGVLIGTVGATGKSTGCHLHFEVRGKPNPLAK